MTSFDKEGILDKYFYSYNNLGLISGINRERRNLDAISGQYDYQYDEIGRLTRSSLNGELRASYKYDAFGNRTSLIESDTQTTYRYDSLDRLVEAKELNNSQAIVRSYDYDKRGNQTNEYVDGLLNKTFTFDATNMLSKVIDSEKGELENQYNGLGFRVASIRPEERIEYLCDLSRDCYNMLERTVNGETESFIYDKNVISMSKATSTYYYLQDELGSPMYMTGTVGAAVSSYAFDDFGRSIDPFTGKIKEAGNKQHTKHAYTTEGNIIQPFAFTGYQEDEVSGLMFAQARFYSTDNGRFVGEDQIRGSIKAPDTQNHYIYCLDRPVSLCDINGKIPVSASVSAGSAVVSGSAASDASNGGIEGTSGYGNNSQNLAESQSVQSDPDAEYVGVIYLNASSGAAIGDTGYAAGHAAILLVKSDGSAEFYSYASTHDAVNEVGVGDGYLSTAVDENGNVTSINAAEFLNNGTVYTDNLNTASTGEYIYDSYDRGIFIPISNDQGKDIHDAAMDLRNNPGTYSLLNNNCNQNAQKLLAAGGVDFAPDSFDWMKTCPNYVYNNYQDLAEKSRWWELWFDDYDKWCDYVATWVQGDLSSLAQYLVDNGYSGCDEG